MLNIYPILKFPWHSAYQEEGILDRDPDAEANCSHSQISQRYFWPAPDPSGFGTIGILPVNAMFPASVLSEGFSRQDWWWGCGYLAKRELLLLILPFSGWESSRLCPHLHVLCNDTQSFRATASISKQDAYISTSLCPLHVGRNIPSSVGFQKYFVSGYLCVHTENKERRKCREMSITLTLIVYISLLTLV